MVRFEKRLFREVIGFSSQIHSNEIGDHVRCRLENKPAKYSLGAG
jgi:hypothetical protein